MLPRLFLSVFVCSHPPPGVDIEQGIGIFYLCFVLLLLYYDYEIMETVSYSLYNFLFLLLVWMEHLGQAGHWQTTLVPFVWQRVTHPPPPQEAVL